MTIAEVGKRHSDKMLLFTVEEIGEGRTKRSSKATGAPAGSDLEKTKVTVYHIHKIKEDLQNI